MYFVAVFSAGALLCNCIPHLAAGLMGLRFPTPFARPRGTGKKSSPSLNFAWGALNALVGIRLLWAHPIAVEFEPHFIAFWAGALLLGWYLSMHFGKMQKNGAGRQA
jgi:hypothetical protein